MSLGFKLYSLFNGKIVSTDTLGNTYFVDKKNSSKRWVIYAKGFGPDSLPTSYHNWLHSTSDILPLNNSNELEIKSVKSRVSNHKISKQVISKGYSAWRPK